MRNVLNDSLVNALPIGAPGLNRFDIADFLAPDSPWHQHIDAMYTTINSVMKQVVIDVRSSLGDDPRQWQWGNLHQIAFNHRLADKPVWQHMKVDPEAADGSTTTLNMAVHMGSGPGQTAEAKSPPCRVYHGPAFRMIVDLGSPEQAQLVIAGGNGGRPDSPFATNQFKDWKAGELHTVHLDRELVEPALTVHLQPV
jgi:penicillin amidase